MDNMSNSIDQKISRFLDQYQTNPSEAFEYLVHHIEITGYKPIFDLFFNQVIHMCPDIDHQMSILLILIKILPEDAEVKLDQRYIKECQSNIKNYTELFEHLICYDFAIDINFIILSICARGELNKMKFLLDNYEIQRGQEEYLFKVALYYGRYQIIEYLHQSFELPTNLCQINNLGFLNHRYMYYTSDITYREYRMDIHHSKQDYERSLNYVLKGELDSHVPINGTPQTGSHEPEPIRYQKQDGTDLSKVDSKEGRNSKEGIKRWIARGKKYEWEKYDLKVILPILMRHTEEIPITEDYGEWNVIIFGQNGSREYLYEKVVQLEEEIEEYRRIYGNLESI